MSNTRHLDRLLAEHLFEWLEVPEPEPHKMSLGINSEGVEGVVPPYAECWREMGRVVEAMRASGYGFTQHAQTGNSQGPWYTAFWEPAPPDAEGYDAFSREHAGSGGTAPEAVARAALAALGVEVKNPTPPPRSRTPRRPPRKPG